MFAFVRKNLASLVTNHTSSVRKSDVPYSVSLHFFWTLRGREVDTTDNVYDVLVHKHQFSPEVASLAASHFTQFRGPVNADLIPSFLQECGFSSIQLEKIVKYNPRILSYSVEHIKFKIKIFQDLGLSPEDIAKIVSSHQVILLLSAKSNIIPTLSLLKGLLGSDYDVARLIRKSGRVILADLERTLLPNVDLLRSCGIPMERILFLLYANPRCLLTKPDRMRKSVEKAKELGFSESSKSFVHALLNFRVITDGMWEVKLQSFRDLGFSDSNTVTMFKKAPYLSNISMKKIGEVKELLLATGKFDMSSMVNVPICFGYSIEKRLKPRLRILGILESKNMIKEWPTLATLCTLSDDKFFERYNRLYLDEDGYVKGKGKER